MTDAFLERFAHGNSYKRRQVRTTIADALGNQTNPDELWAALEQLGETSKPVTANTLQFAFSKIRGTYQQHDNVIALASGQPLPGPDTNLAGWGAVAASLANHSTEDSA
jgi:hypothetical protein